jgi:hypothetical protein
LCIKIKVDIKGYFMRRQDTKKPCHDGRFSKRKGPMYLWENVAAVEGAVEI